MADGKTRYIPLLITPITSFRVVRNNLRSASCAPTCFVFKQTTSIKTSIQPPLSNSTRSWTELERPGGK